MRRNMEFLKESIDYIIFAILGLMGFITVWLSIERWLFLRNLSLATFCTRNPIR